MIISYSSLRLETKKEHKLIIIGTGKDKYVTKLKELVLEKNLDQFVQFIGHKTGLEKTNLLSNSKMLVFPSHTENFGNVILEAYASYLPCICSKNTPWSVLDKLKIGYTYIPGSENLTSKIYKILSWDQNKYMDACLSGRNFINNKYSVDKNYHKVSAFLKKLIE